MSNSYRFSGDCAVKSYTLSDSTWSELGIKSLCEPSTSDRLRVRSIGCPNFLYLRRKICCLLILSIMIPHRDCVFNRSAIRRDFHLLTLGSLHEARWGGGGGFFCMYGIYSPYCTYYQSFAMRSPCTSSRGTGGGGGGRGGKR